MWWYTSSRMIHCCCWIRCDNMHSHILYAWTHTYTGRHKNMKQFLIHSAISSSFLMLKRQNHQVEKTSAIMGQNLRHCLRNEGISNAIYQTAFKTIAIIQDLPQTCHLNTRNRPQSMNGTTATIVITEMVIIHL